MIGQGALDISSMFYAIGAEHYYGVLHIETKGGTKRIELTHPLTQKEATYLNKKDGIRQFARYKKGFECSRFWSEDQVKRAALKIIKKDYPDFVIVLGGFEVCSAQPIFYAPADFPTQKMNDLAKEWLDIDGYEGNEVRAGLIDKKFQKILENYLQKFKS